jgi:hypothetical protein
MRASVGAAGAPFVATLEGRTVSVGTRQEAAGGGTAGQHKGLAAKDLRTKPLESCCAGAAQQQSSIQRRVSKILFI